jgi:hypothetical protein
MFKGMALICSVWIANGEAKQECFTHMFGWETQTKKECQLKLMEYQIHKMRTYHKLILSECIFVKES